VKRLSEKNGDSEQQVSDDNGVTLNQILRVAKLKYVFSLADFLFPFFNFFFCRCLIAFFFFFCLLLSSYFVFCSLVEFFKELPQFLVKAGPILSDLYGADWENRLEVLM